jgi:lysophospholipase L1-like esterase
LPAGTKQLELWMPQNAAITIHDLRVDAGAHAEPSPAGRPRWLHYGSSISHGKEAHGPADTWPAIVARQAGLDLTSYAYSGNCLLEGFIAQALAQDDAADVITLEIGINIITSDAMRERAFVPAVHNFLDIIRDRRPDVPVLVISPVFSGVFETQPGPALRTPNGIASIARPSELADGALSATLVRDLLESLVARRRAQGDRRLDYADGRNLFGAGDASHLVDGLHPGAHGHRLMGQRAAAMVEAFWHSAR